jgi:HK97 family phage portal protein
MGLLERIEERGQVLQLGHPSSGDPVLVNWFGGPPAQSGVSFDAEGALGWTALSRGVRLSSATIASLPWGVYEALDRGRRPRPDHPVDWLLRVSPNEEQTAFEFHELQQAHSLWWGCSYAQIVRDGAGRIMELWPLNPDRVQMQRIEDALWFRVILPENGPGSGGSHLMVPARDMLWVRGFGTHGLLGTQLATLHREAIGLAIATEIYCALFFGHGASAGGVLSSANKLSDKARERLKESLAKRAEGLSRAHKLLLLEEGLTFTQMTVDPEKAQLLGLRTYSVIEAARIVEIPPHMLYALEHATFSNIEHQSLEFVRDHVRPWVTRREQRYNLQLFGPKEYGRVYVKANLNALMRGDFKSRMEGYAIMIQNRITTPNEVREWEELNPGPGILDEFQVTPNLRAPSEVPPPAPPPAPPPPPAPVPALASQGSA